MQVKKYKIVLSVLQWIQSMTKKTPDVRVIELGSIIGEHNDSIIT
jgi:hypothetical protein